jgi:hypothetical protein
MVGLYFIGTFKILGKRAGGVDPVKFIITDSTNIKRVPLTTLLSHIETKAQLRQYLGKSVPRACANSTKNIIVTYGTTTYANTPGLFDLRFTEHNYDEADTLILLHIIDVQMYVNYGIFMLCHLTLM